jgi:hypothetical protein
VTNKPTTPHDAKKQADVAYPGMMGDGTEEQNLNQRGNPAAHITKEDVDAAFAKQTLRKIAPRAIQVVRRSPSESFPTRGWRRRAFY